MQPRKFSLLANNKTTALNTDALQASANHYNTLFTTLYKLQGLYNGSQHHNAAEHDGVDCIIL